MNTPIKFCSEAYSSDLRFFTSPKYQTQDPGLKVSPIGLLLRILHKIIIIIIIIIIIKIINVYM